MTSGSTTGEGFSIGDDSVAQSLVLEEREVERGVVRDDRDPRAQQGADGACTISSTTSQASRPSARARSVEMPCTRAAPSGISMPGSASQSCASTTLPAPSSTPTYAVTMRSFVDVDAGGLEVEDRDVRQQAALGGLELCGDVIEYHAELLEIDLGDVRRHRAPPGGGTLRGREAATRRLARAVQIRQREQRRGIGYDVFIPLERRRDMPQTQARHALNSAGCPCPRHTPPRSSGSPSCRNRSTRAERARPTGSTGPTDSEMTILAVHGFRGDHHGLEPVVAQMPDVRWIMPDLPGFGRDPADRGPYARPPRVHGMADGICAHRRTRGDRARALVRIDRGVCGGRGRARDAAADPREPDRRSGPRGAARRADPARRTSTTGRVRACPRRLGTGAAALAHHRADHEHRDGEDA